MPSTRKSLVTSAEGEAEASRLRAMLEGTFPTLATLRAESEGPALGDEAIAAPSAETAQGLLEGSLGGSSGGSSDWAVTLANIAAMTAMLREHGERLAAAETRASRAEARAAEAETWLRRLHQAVLDGLPAARRA